MVSQLGASSAQSETGLKYLQPAKLVQPFRPAVEISRAELCEELCQPQAPRVSLIRAPAGFGKSTLMQQARAELNAAGVASAWLSLDAADNDVPRLLHFLNQALQLIGSPAATLPENLSAGQIALELLDGLASLPTPCVLFLDDLESLQNPVALALVRQLIDHLPEGARLVMGSRAIPDIGLTRLRSSGQLLELDTARLRFSAQETAHLLQEKNSLILPQNQLNRLQEMTEGWPAALWLVSMLIESSGNPAEVIDSFSGSSALMADYLSEEVLLRQSPELCEFMLCTSILPQLSASLCDAILGDDRSRERLSQLEQSHLFLVPLDLERKWYRYHSLFSGFLREQLQLRYPSRVAALHRAAAHWYLQQQRQVPAIEQALKSGDMELALPLFSRHAQRLLGEGRAQLLSRLLASVDAGVLQAWPELQVIHIWAMAFTRGAADAMALLQDYEAADEAGSVSKQVLMLNARALKPMLLSMLDRHDEACQLALVDLQRLPAEHVFPHAILRTSLAYVTLVMGHYSEAQALLDEGRRLNVIDRSPFTNIYAQSVEGVIELLQGHLRQATSRFRLAAGERQGAGRFATNGNAMAAILLAETLYESGQHADCERLLKVYVPLMQQQGVPDHLICGHRNLARVYLGRGDVDSALRTINELEYYGQRNGLPRLVACAHLERARLYLLAKDEVASREEIQRAEAVLDWLKIDEWYLFGTDVEYLALAEWRWQIHFGQPGKWLEALSTAIDCARRQRRGRRANKLEVLRIIGLEKAGRHNDAVTQLQQLLRSLHAEQSLQLLLDEGEVLIEIMKRLACMQPGGWDEELLQQPQALFERLLAVEVTVEAGVGQGHDECPQLLEKLTKKETSVLQLLAEGLSNNAIGERLFVSESTVRTHLRNINAKLHSKSRTEAVAVARRVGLLP